MILFLIFHGFDPNNGISKKITYQVNALKACGMETHLCYIDEEGTKKRIVDGTVIADYGNGAMSKILKRTGFSSITRYAIDNGIKFVYIRSNHNANPFTIRMVKQMKKAGMKVVLEIPTYPYDSEYEAQGMSRQIFQDKLFRNQLAKHLDAIVTFSDYDIIFGQKTIRISNGIDFDTIQQKKGVNDTTHELHLIGVAEIHRWHGFDRIIKGLAKYYSTNPEYKVFFHIVGYFFSPVEEKEISRIIQQQHLEEYVITHGKRHGQELDAIFEKCDFGIGSLGRHRVGIDKIKTLKNREYAARGIPFIYSETDSVFDNNPYVLKAPADESSIDINKIVSFYKSLSISPQEIRDSISNLSWKHQMKQVIDTIYPTPASQRPIKLAYCIPSLNHSGGMERVLTTKANYLAERLGYDVNIIITDNKDTQPFFPLSPKVNVVQLEVNIDNLWEYPIWKRFFIYRQKMRIYKQRMERCLKLMRPDITISMLRREINFLPDLQDGSIKMGEIHFGRYKYRETNFNFLPSFANQLISRLWMLQLTNKLKRLQQFVVLTYEDAKAWKELDNITVIPNPITIETNQQSDCSSHSVVAVGRYTYQKGFDLLIKAWEIVHQKHPDWILDIYGGGDNAAYQQLADQAGLHDTVRCNPLADDISTKYVESSIFVLSSRFEGFGLVIAEAMLCGIPPVSFACPCGPRDIIHDGEDGILCENGNISELANGICCLIEDEKKRKEMGAIAAKNIQRYRLDNIMQQWDHLFQGMVSQDRNTNKEE